MRLVTALLSVLALPALAYPIPPQTIWELSARSEHIVVAHVDRVERATPRTARGPPPVEDDDVAVLAVEETWKGKAEKELRVHFEAGVVCPAPPRFIVGARVVAFLREWKGSLVVTALSYGTRYPVDDAELQQLRSATKDALSRQQGAPADAGVGPPPEEWSLGAVKGSATRWDGLYSLASGADEARSYYDRNRPPRGPSAQALSALEQAFVVSPSLDSTLPTVLRMLSGQKSSAVSQAAVDAIEAVLRQQVAPYWMEDAIGLLEARLGAPPEQPKKPGDALEREFANINATREEPEKAEERIQKRWADVKARYSLKPAPGRKLEPIRRPRVGGDSPL